MSALWIVARKELVDTFRDRRTILTTLLMGPLLMPLLLIGMGSLAQKKFAEKIEKPLAVPIVNASAAPNLVAWLKSQNLEVKPVPKDVDQALRDQDFDAVLEIGRDFADDWRSSKPATVKIIRDSSQSEAAISIDRLEALLKTYSQQVGSLRLLARGIHPMVASPLNVAYREAATPQSKMGQFLNFLPYVLILAGFLGGMHIAIDSTAGERERQSLEPLLATPVSRQLLMSGKLTAACAFASIALILTLLAFKLTFLLSPINPLGMKIDVSWWTVLKSFIVLLPMVMFGSCLLTTLAAFAKSTREAQSYLSILLLLPMIPSLMLMIAPVKNQLWMMAVPFLSQNQLIIKLIRGEAISATEWAVYFVTGMFLVLIVWWIGARLYRREQLGLSG